MKTVFIILTALFTVVAFAKNNSRSLAEAVPTKVIYGKSELREEGTETAVFVDGEVAEVLYKKLNVDAKPDRDSGRMIKAAGNIRCNEGADNGPSCVIFLEKNGKTGRIRNARYDLGD